MAMTLEQVRDRLRSVDGGPIIWAEEGRDLADAIDAHLAKFTPDWAGYRQGLEDGKAEALSQPAQAVDVGAVREVIDSHIEEAKKLTHDPESQDYLYEQADRLTRAIGTAQEGWRDVERKASPERQTDMLLARMVLREVIVPPAPAAPTDGEG